MTIILYHHKGACSLAPLIALEESGIAFTLAVIDLLTGQAEYKRINPAGKVPALLIDGELLTENIAILYRIAALAPEAALFPSDLAAASRMISLMAWFGSTVHILRRQIHRPQKFTPDKAAQATLVDASRPLMWEAMQEMEDRLGGATWFSGERFGVADGYALVFYGWALENGFPMSELARLTDWMERMLARPAVQAALRNDAGPLHDRVMKGAG